MSIPALPSAFSESGRPTGALHGLEPVGGGTEAKSTPATLPAGLQAIDIERIVAMTAQLFPGPVRIETDIDPDFPDARRLVVEVEAQGDFRDILERESRWHDNLWELIGKSAGMHFGLCVFPK